MEEVKAYIESGILELYVLGQLSVREHQEVEAMAAKYPEVKKEIEAIEIALERYAVNNAIEPAEELKDKVIKKINANKSAERYVEPESAANPEEASAAIRNTVISPQHTGLYESKIRNLRLALVACATLLIISVIALFSARTKLDAARSEILTLNSDKTKFAHAVNQLEEKNADLQKISEMTDDPDWRVVKLSGTTMDPAAKMIVYWHRSGQHVMVDNSKMALPANDQEHQYQLWALVNGKPVDLGVFDVKTDSTDILLKMKEVAGAEAFAVTLEKRGGNTTPTMDKMIVMGAISI